MRLFVAIALPELVKQHLALLGGAGGGPGAAAGGMFGARWADPANMHVTLRFIGEADRPLAEDVHAALATLRAPAFEIRLAGMGTFGSDRKIRQLWVGVEKTEPLMRLQGKIEQALIRLGLAPDGRKYLPHVLLARFKGDPGPRLGPYLEANNAFSIPPFRVEDFTLFESHLNRDGASYEPLADYPLLRATTDAA
jgi:2'-5' RNA ligase